MDQRLSRRRIWQLGIAAAASAALARSASVIAQDEENPIQSTRRGEMPTTGGVRPGPMGMEPSAPPAAGTSPVLIEIPKIQVSAQIEVRQIVNGVMENPTGPWVVSWYEATAPIGEPGNAVFAGHLDYWDVGPSVFYNVGQLVEGDEILLTGEDGGVYTYSVEWNTLYDASNAPIDEIVGATRDEVITLITCGGPFDYQNGVYLQRTVVRAKRKGD